MASQSAMWESAHEETTHRATLAGEMIAFTTLRGLHHDYRRAA
jgi:hypothetical protein